MSQQFSVGDRVRLIGEPPREGQWNDYTGRIGEVVERGTSHYVRVRWKGSLTKWWYYLQDIAPASIFYAETDKKGLVI